MAYKKDPNEIGAAWEKIDKNDNPWFSGYIELDGVRTQLSIFKNGYKKADNHPDYIIKKFVPREKPNEEAVRKKAPYRDDERPSREPGSDDDIPF